MISYSVIIIALLLLVSIMVVIVFIDYLQYWQLTNWQ